MSLRVLVAALLLTVAPATLVAQDARLNISIEVFDPGLPADPSTWRDLDVFPRIREFEALLLPFALRETLADSGEWGAVRIVPEPDPAAELFLSARILGSDGLSLGLHVVAVDASGRVWIDQAYADTPASSGSDDDALSGARVFSALYAAIAEDLTAARNALLPGQLARIPEISMLRHAAILLPTAFADYLNAEADGTWSLLRLPALDDPMLERIQRIRGVEYVMTDAVDEKFQQLHDEIARTYDVWRDYRQAYAEYLAEEARWQASDRSDAAPGSFEAVERTYDNYRWARMADQEQRKWARAFDNEVGPAIERIESRVAELDGWVDDNYSEWQRLLAEIFTLETGLAD